VVHTKAIAVDDAFASLGSYNFDRRSLAYNLELVVNVVDVGYAADVVGMLDKEIADAEEVTAETFGHRSPFVRLLERLAYGLRKWL
jgi:cardiolipin synthase